MMYNIYVKELGKNSVKQSKGTGCGGGCAGKAQVQDSEVVVGKVRGLVLGGRVHFCWYWN